MSNNSISVEDNDRNIFLRFEDFFHDFLLGYYCPRVGRMSWGIWAECGPGDDSLVWRGDAGMPAQEMAAETEKLALESGNPCYGVYLSPSWTGNVEAFVRQLKGMGWVNTFNVSWLTMRLEGPPPVSVPEGFDISILPLSQVKATPDLVGLSDPSAGESMLKEPDSPTNVRRLIAIAIHSESGKTAGIGLAAHGSGMGYMYALRVDPEFRSKGLAKALVAARLDALYTQGAHEVFTAVAQDNAVSLNIQLKQGYLPFASTHAWQPPGHHSGAYEVDSGLKAVP